MLRGCLVAVGIAGVVAGAVLFISGAAWPAAIELVALGAVLTLGILFERRGYRPRIDRSSGNWEETGERFIDPVTGHLIEVRYNPDTGQRDYVDRGRSE